MNDAETIQAAELLFASAKLMGVESFEPDARQFGLACDEELALGSTYAKLFLVSSRGDGRHACESRSMIGPDCTGYGSVSGHNGLEDCKTCSSSGHIYGAVPCCQCKATGRHACGCNGCTGNVRCTMCKGKGWTR